METDNTIYENNKKSKNKGLPSGWIKIQLNELAFIKGRVPRKFYNFEEKNTVRYLTPEYLRGRDHKTLYCNINESEIVNGDVIILWDGSNAGEVFFARYGAIASTMAKIKIDKKFHKRFFYYYLKFYEPILKYQIKGSGIPHVEKDIFGLLPNIFPPLPEQRKIAEILETIDNAIEKTDAIIEKYKRIKQGLMQELLTKGITAFEFEKDKLITAVKKAFENGDHTFGREENLINHLSGYLREQFPEWNVDSEVEKDSNRRIPDIIIHKRDPNENLFAIEIKKNEDLDAIKKDVEKLENLMLEEYRYEDAVFIGFNVESFDEIFKLSDKVNFILVSKDGEIRVKSRVRRFKDSPLGRIPEEWEVVELGEVGKIVSGSTPDTSKPEFWDGNIIWVTPDDLSKLNTRYIHTSKRKITEKGLKNCSAKLIPPNSIVISSRAPIGYLAISKVKFTTNQGCKSIIPNSSNDPDFFYYCLHIYIVKMITLGSGTTFSEISKSDLEKMKISIPKSKSEQRHIAEILSQIDKAIEKEKIYKQKLERIKQGLMEDLFTGKVRVNHLI